jgi:hypothetical protein
MTRFTSNRSTGNFCIEMPGRYKSPFSLVAFQTKFRWCKFLWRGDIVSPMTAPTTDFFMCILNMLNVSNAKFNIVAISAIDSQPA